VVRGAEKRKNPSEEGRSLQGVGDDPLFTANHSPSVVSEEGRSPRGVGDSTREARIQAAVMGPKRVDPREGLETLRQLP